MKTIKLILTVFVCTILNLNAFSQNGVTIAISTTTKHGVWNYGMGIDFAVRNIDTDIIYRSKSLNNVISRHAIIVNVPKGKYEILIGPEEYSSNNDSVVMIFFGILDFTKYEAYYLGDFRGETPRGWNKPWYLKDLRRDTPRRLTRVLRRRGFLDKGKELFTDLKYSSSDLVLPPLR